MSQTPEERKKSQRDRARAKRAEIPRVIKPKQTKEEKNLWYREYRKKNKEKLNARKRKLRELNKDKIREYQKTYRENNKEALLEKRRLWHSKQEQSSNYMLSLRLKSRMRQAIIKGSGFKIGLSQELLGCDWQTVKEWLESQFVDGMSWDNHGVDGWHIDHKIPCSFFDMTNEYEQKQCFHYTNLQPLWAKDNIIKADKIDFSDLFE